MSDETPEQPKYRPGVSMDGNRFSITDTVHDEYVVTVRFLDEACRLTLYQKAELLKELADTVLNTPEWANRRGPMFDEEPPH